MKDIPMSDPVTELKRLFDAKKFDEAIEFCQKLLEKDPIKRIGCGVKGTKEIKTHKWYETLDWEKIESKGYAAPWVPPLKGDADVVETEEYWDPVFQADSYSWEESDWCHDF